MRMREIILAYLVGFLMGTLATCIFPASADAAPIKIAIIDTGFNRQMAPSAKLCRTGHYDFYTDMPIVGMDHNSHGSTIANIIHDGLKDIDYCIVVYKLDFMAKDSVVRALNAARKERVKVINFSILVRGEIFKTYRAMYKLKKNGVSIFVAAGNDSKDLNKACDSYPSCFRTLKPQIKVIGAKNHHGHPSTYSNTGTVIDYWFSGHYKGGFGTSFAAPKALVSWVKMIKEDNAKSR